MTDSDYPLVDDLDLGLYFENTNSGNTTNVEMRVRGASTSVFGDLRRFNEYGAQIVQDFPTQVAFGGIPKFDVVTKFGRNGDVDTGTTPEDLWNGGSTYTGFNATANQELQVFSSDVDDQGDAISSGTATGGTKTTLVDSGADFVTTDGVAVGDLLINDTIAAHGIITAVTATQITVFQMVGGRSESLVNTAGHSYRVVNANDTGAAVVLIDQILNADYEEQDPVYVVLNGTTAVTTSGVDAMRAPRAQVILAGSSGRNEGTITVRQATTTANVFAVMPAFGRTTIGAMTIPAGKAGLLKRVRAAITRENGSAGSATITLNTRRHGEAWQAIRAFEIQTGAAVEFVQIGGDLLGPGTDIKFTIDSVSDNNTVIDGAIELIMRTL